MGERVKVLKVRGFRVFSGYGLGFKGLWVRGLGIKGLGVKVLRD